MTIRSPTEGASSETLNYYVYFFRLKNFKNQMTRRKRRDKETNLKKDRCAVGDSKKNNNRPKIRVEQI